MTIRKIADLPNEKLCRSLQHEPPPMISLPPGIYGHTCPKCGRVTVFKVMPPGSMGISS